MKRLEIIGFKRANLGKTEAAASRMEGSVPCVLYGGKEQVHFKVAAYFFKNLVYTEDPHFVDLIVDGEKYECKLQEVQFHPVNEMILHADFLLLNPERPIKMEIPLNFTGTSPGVVKGGKLIPKLRRILLKALPKNMPESINVDISNLELGKSVKVAEIKEQNFQILNPKSNPVVSVEVPRALKGETTGAEAEAGAEA